VSGKTKEVLVERLKGALEEASATAGALLQEEQHVVGRRIRVPAKESLADMASEDENGSESDGEWEEEFGEGADAEPDGEVDDDST
jgi:hypothetical protein